MALKPKDLPLAEALHPGNLACAGCAQMLAFRHALKVLGPNTIVVNQTGCLAVVCQMGVPAVPHFHVLFENAAAVASGIDDALRVTGKREGVNLLVVAGDGGTADIGLAALSGAVERNQDFIYLCFDNESYMNTGGQRSGTTPFGARTTTTPVGAGANGEPRAPALRKDMVEIMAAHNIPYVASTSIGYPLDFVERVKKAATVRGPSYIHCHSPCPPGWGVDSKDIIEVARLAVETGCVVLYEIENGARRLTKRVSQRRPVTEYLKHQSRFRHVLLDLEQLAAVQLAVDESYAAAMRRIEAAF
ncbi:MAG: pyruvate synthase subunit beta [Deltaproteobacteria bacterium]|nr:pyruvate synthase subunit beta [Deltaproteobacteria bacterium]